MLCLPLSIGKAFTLSAALRLFVVLFFTFVLFRRWNISEASALFGAIAYAFCTFHVIWLLFPLGLSSMTLPMVLVAADLVVEEKTIRAHALLTIALALCVLGGHPESALFVWIAGVLYLLYRRRALFVP